MGHGARGGRVGLLAVAVGGVGGAREADWDVAMFRRAGRGGQMAQAAREDSGGQTLSLDQTPAFDVTP